jgi:hypothetical protein
VQYQNFTFHFESLLYCITLKRSNRVKIVQIVRTANTVRALLLLYWSAGASVQESVGLRGNSWRLVEVGDYCHGEEGRKILLQQQQRNYSEDNGILTSADDVVKQARWRNGVAPKGEPMRVQTEPIVHRSNLFSPNHYSLPLLSLIFHSALTSRIFRTQQHSTQSEGTSSASAKGTISYLRTIFIGFFRLSSVGLRVRRKSTES